MPITENTGLMGRAPVVPGGIANTQPHLSHTCLSSAATVDTALGGIPFGRGCTILGTLPTDLGAYDRLPVELAAAGNKFMGVAQFTDSVVGTLNGKPDDFESPRGYLPDRELALVYKGLVGVEVEGAVTPASSVFVVVTPGADHGKFRADADGGAAIAVPNASFRGSAAAGGTVALYLDLIL